MAITTTTKLKGKGRTKFLLSTKARQNFDFYWGWRGRDRVFFNESSYKRFRMPLEAPPGALSHFLLAGCLWFSTSSLLLWLWLLLAFACPLLPLLPLISYTTYPLPLCVVIAPFFLAFISFRFELPHASFYDVRCSHYAPILARLDSQLYVHTLARSGFLARFGVCVGFLLLFGFRFAIHECIFLCSFPKSALYAVIAPFFFQVYC